MRMRGPLCKTKDYRGILDYLESNQMLYCWWWTKILLVIKKYFHKKEFSGGKTLNINAARIWTSWNPKDWWICDIFDILFHISSRILLRYIGHSFKFWNILDTLFQIPFRTLTGPVENFETNFSLLLANREMILWAF